MQSVRAGFFVVHSVCVREREKVPYCGIRFMVCSKALLQQAGRIGLSGGKQSIYRLRAAGL
ncbi:hypothetical protein ICC18_16895 [Paenibacillus sp. WST5]|uniref:Uncharacterized protein n=1 Tax=Paenibacillus sedimenti TaxID=2770274 RepID=A0A926QKU9_9BACL|nr:hypothetical protein [Paenibacillus sedimenti]